MFRAFMIAACLSLAGIHHVPVRAADPLPLSAYGELPGLEDAAVAPSGKTLAILGIYNGERRLLIVDDGMVLRKAIEVNDLKIRGFQWVGDDMLLLRTSRTEPLPYGFTTDQAEFTMAMLVSIKGNEPTRIVFSENRDIVGRIFGFYGVRQIAGRPIGYFGGIELFRSRTGSRVGEYEFEHGRPALYEVDLLENKAKKLANAPHENVDRDWLVNGAGEVVVTFDLEEKSGNWRIYNSERTTLAQGQDPLGRVMLLALGKDGSTVIYRIRDGEDGEARYFEVPLAGGIAPHEVFGDVSLSRFYVDDGNGHLLGYLEDADAPVPVLFNSKHQSTARAVRKAFPKLNSMLVEWSQDFGHLLVRTDGNGDSGSWYFVNVEKGTAEFFGSERPAITPDRVGPISTVAYVASDGLELDGILTLPSGQEAKNLPIVMLPHGGPRSHDTESFDWWAQAFAARGYAVFQPNFRGSTNRDEAFVRAGYGEWGGKMQTDISDGLAHLAAHGIVDPKRACIMGASYGGYAALAGVTLQKGIYRCAVAVAPVTDLEVTFNTDYRESGRNRMVHRSLLEELGPRDRYDEISPRKQAHRADAPILLIHGREDTVVPYRQSELMADALKDADKPFEFVDLREEDHWLTRSKTRLQMLEAAMAFILKHNPPD